MVHLYEFNYGGKHRRLDSEKTDAQGIARFPGADGKSVFVVAQQGDNWALDTNNIYFGRRYRESAEKTSLVYTDRSIYRPDQKLYFKVVAYSRATRSRAHGDRKRAPSWSSSLIDANNQEVAKQELTSNEFGSAAGEFLIPSGRLLGGWRVEVRGSYSGQTGVRVEEYKAANLRGEAVRPTEALRLGRKATLPGEARFFGLPVTSGRWCTGLAASRSIPGGGLLRFPDAEWQSDGGQRHRRDRRKRWVQDRLYAECRRAAGGRKNAKDISYRYLVKADLTDEGARRARHRAASDLALSASKRRSL